MVIEGPSKEQVAFATHNSHPIERWKDGAPKTGDEVVVEEVPIVWLVEQDYANFMDKKLQNVITTAIGVHETFGTVSIT